MAVNLNMFKQYVLFAGVGAIGTAGHYLVLVLLVEWFSVAPVAATTAAFMVGAIINYILNYKYTFSSDKPHLQAMSKFFSIATVGMLFNGLIMDYGVQHLELHYLVTQVVATILVMQWNFFANKLWTFSVGR
jgi:putative flippase GtrA